MAPHSLPLPAGAQCAVCERARALKVPRPRRRRARGRGQRSVGTARAAREARRRQPQRAARASYGRHQCRASGWRPTSSAAMSRSSAPSAAARRGRCGQQACAGPAGACAGLGHRRPAVVRRIRAAAGARLRGLGSTLLEPVGGQVAQLGPTRPAGAARSSVSAATRRHGASLIEGLRDVGWRARPDTATRSATPRPRISSCPSGRPRSTEVERIRPAARGRSADQENGVALGHGQQRLGTEALLPAACANDTHAIGGRRGALAEYTATGDDPPSSPTTRITMRSGSIATSPSGGRRVPAQGEE